MNCFFIALFNQKESICQKHVFDPQYLQTPGAVLSLILVFISRTHAAVLSIFSCMVFIVAFA